MRRVAIIAPTGMLGSMVYNVLKNFYELVLVYRDENKLSILDKVYGDVSAQSMVVFDLNDIFRDYVKGFSESVLNPSAKKLFESIGNVDTVINCAGIIKPHSLNDIPSTIFINGTIPHILSSFYKEKLIHITTDCVYNGMVGAPYNENSQKTPVDLYGFTKSMGEPSDSSLVLRTSIIGPEITGFFSLLEWFKKQEGKMIKGFTNHFWNGITTLEFGNICNKIILQRNDFPKSGIFHVFSTSISKYDMLIMFREKYETRVSIVPAEAPPIDRRLGSIYDVNTKLFIPSFSEMLFRL